MVKFIRRVIRVREESLTVERPSIDQRLNVPVSFETHLTFRKFQV